MRRAPRLCVYAIGMLAVAVLACAALRDEELERKGAIEVSGRIESAAPSRQAALPNSPRPSTPDADARNAAPASPRTPAGTASFGAASSEQQSRDTVEPVRVKALSLARAAAANGDIPASLSEGGRPAPAVPVQTVESAPNKAGEAPRLSAEPATQSRPAPNAAPAPRSAVQKSAVRAVSKAPPAAPSKTAPQTAEAKVGKVKKAAPKPADKSKLSAKAAPVRHAGSPVEAALADARAGRLAPSGGMVIEKSAARYERVVTSAKYAMKGSLIKLVLRGNAPMVGNFYVLTEPDRVVLDLAGNWEIDLPKVPSNRLIAAARVGQHDDKTRLVFDMKNTGKVALVPLNRNALELRIQ